REPDPLPSPGIFNLLIFWVLVLYLLASIARAARSRIFAARLLWFSFRAQAHTFGLVIDDAALQAISSWEVRLIGRTTRYGRVDCVAGHYISGPVIRRTSGG
ncbi:hypothetical protein, partial [Nocardia sp. NPDC059154]